MNSWKHLLRIFFHLLYHPLAFSYDLVAWLVSLGRWQAWVTQVCNYLDRSPILELGFGPGHLQQRLLDSGRPVFGLDESRFMCQLAARRLRKKLGAGISPTLCRGLAQNLPFAAGSFKTVIATFPSEYIYNKSTILECERVLASGGQLIILAAVNWGGSTLLERLLRGLFKVTYQSGDPEEAKQIVADLFIQHGFRIHFDQRNYRNDRLWFIRAQKGVSPLSE